MSEIVITGNTSFKYNGVDAKILGKNRKTGMWTVVQYRLGEMHRYHMTAEEIAEAMRLSEAERRATTPAEDISGGRGIADTTRRMYGRKPSYRRLRIGDATGINKLVVT